MAHYAIMKTDGSVAIMQTIPQVIVGNTVDPAPLAEIAKWHPDQRAKVVSVAEIDPAVIPQDRTFRNAWMLSGDKIDHDMDKARAIKRDMIRAARAPLLAVLDVEYQRADEAGDSDAKAAVAAKKQTLRDVPANPAIDAAKTVEDLKAITLPE